MTARMNGYLRRNSSFWYISLSLFKLPHFQHTVTDRFSGTAPNTKGLTPPDISRHHAACRPFHELQSIDCPFCVFDFQ
ncbi:hypothetical protein HZ326_10937 [Fusarium oxysporum f. sp. albedinis]|nr:hypothetical protein HZ326_10937 [Fusarium oxysporum f. sp. albedinis]